MKIPLFRRLFTYAQLQPADDETTLRGVRHYTTILPRPRSPSGRTDGRKNVTAFRHDTLVPKKNRLVRRFHPLKSSRFISPTVLDETLAVRGPLSAQTPCAGARAVFAAATRGGRRNLAPVVVDRQTAEITRNRQ